MCRTVHALLQVVICGIQMLVRVFMTVILMIENLIRMVLQTLYNFISFMLQLLSLLPICLVFLLSTRLKCFMCGGGGPCPVARGGTCDCLMSGMAVVVLFLIFRATGVLDKIFYKVGYVKARPLAFTKFVPTPGDITECSRNSTDDLDDDNDLFTTLTLKRLLRTNNLVFPEPETIDDDKILTEPATAMEQTTATVVVPDKSESVDYITNNWTTVIYYVV